MRAVQIDATGFFLADIPGDPAYTGAAGTAPAMLPAESAALLRPRWNGAAWEEGATVEAVDAAAREAAARTGRAWRNRELARADIEILKLEDAGADAGAWRQYRAALRAMPQQHEDARQWVRPQAPQ